MADVARLAGVSVTTVSHVINGTRPASEVTRRSVLAAIEKTGYRPNTLARALARGGTQSLGLAISGLSNPYFMDVVAAIEQAAGRAGHTLLLGDTRDILVIEPLQPGKRVAIKGDAGEHEGTSP